jgi:FKBP-type peptidyl-prolyl cis-trans isomerase (trigger factor)
MPHSHKHFDKLKSETVSGEAHITGELTLEFLSECRAEAIRHLSETIKIDGFRQGHVPENVIVQKVGEMKILEEAAEIGLGSEYRNIVTELKLSPIGRPNIAVTKLAPGIPLEFKIDVALEPEFDLPDYKKIAAGVAKEALKEDVTDEERFWSREKRRAAIIEALVKETKIELPKLLQENENRSKAELILVKIGNEEKIEPTVEELEAEAQKILSHHPEADPMRARIYVYQILRNTKTLEFLESL